VSLSLYVIPSKLSWKVPLLFTRNTVIAIFPLNPVADSMALICALTVPLMVCAANGPAMNCLIRCVLFPLVESAFTLVVAIELLVVVRAITWRLAACPVLFHAW
jgi:hypothetical protein